MRDASAEECDFPQASQNPKYRYLSEKKRRSGKTLRGDENGICALTPS
jgi:hypothetical protein